MRSIPIILLTLLVVLSGCAQEPMQEFTQQDVFSDFDNVDYSTVSIYGIALGDAPGKVVDTLGEPNTKNAFIEDGIINMEYTFGGKTGLIFHFDHNELTRITVYEPFNVNLHGTTKIGLTKEEVYRQLGIPSKFIDKLKIRIFRYEEKGVDVFLFRKVQTGFSIYNPEKAYGGLLSE